MSIVRGVDDYRFMLNTIPGEVTNNIELLNQSKLSYIKISACL